MRHIPSWKTFLILLACCAGILFSFPNLLNKSQLSSLPEWLRPVSLGLDLQGGSQLLLEVDVKAGMKDQLNSLVDSVRASLRSQKIGYSRLSVRGDSVVFKIRNLDQIDEAQKVLSKNIPEGDIKINPEGLGSITYTTSAKEEITKTMLAQSIEMVRRRVDEFGTTEPNIQQQGADNILVQLPGVSDPVRVREILGKTAKLTFRLVHLDSRQLIAEGRVPPGYEKLAGEDHQFYIVSKKVLLGGEKLTSAGPGFDDFGKPAVNFKLDSAGARIFAEVTSKNSDHLLAIVLDNKVISAPKIDRPITGGNGQITGSFTVQETNDLSILMRAGALPAPLHVIEERTVGPDLGADSIAAGKAATIYAIVLVAIFMLLVYSFFGIIADIAVIFNIIFLIALLSITQATLTLPGIAGIALTIGMAVDANVLINERIKEEIRNGQKLASAIDAGYNRAMATIIDSNLTTLLGALFLYTFGTGAIRGFAVTLAMGIIISMFTAISLTRMIVYYWYRWRHPKKLPI